MILYYKLILFFTYHYFMYILRSYKVTIHTDMKITYIVNIYFVI